MSDNIPEKDAPACRECGTAKRPALLWSELYVHDCNCYDDCDGDDYRYDPDRERFCAD